MVRKNIKKVKSIFDIRKQNKQKLFIVLIFFLGSFAFEHAYSIYVGKGIVFIKGYHIHHFYFGTLSLALGGILAILKNNNRRMIQIASMFIGIGLGLFGDEIGLLLNCTSENKFCTYAFPRTDDIILCLTAIIIFLIAIADSELHLFNKKYFKKALKLARIDKVD